MFDSSSLIGYCSVKDNFFNFDMKDLTCSCNDWNSAPYLAVMLVDQPIRGLPSHFVSNHVPPLHSQTNYILPENLPTPTFPVVNTCDPITLF